MPLTKKVRITTPDYWEAEATEIILDNLPFKRKFRPAHSAENDDAVGIHEITVNVPVDAVKALRRAIIDYIDPSPHYETHVPDHATPEPA